MMMPYLHQKNKDSISLAFTSEMHHFQNSKRLSEVGSHSVAIVESTGGKRCPSCVTSISIPNTNDYFTHHDFSLSQCLSFTFLLISAIYLLLHSLGSSSASLLTTTSQSFLSFSHCFVHTFIILLCVCGVRILTAEQIDHFESSLFFFFSSIFKFSGEAESAFKGELPHCNEDTPSCLLAQHESVKSDTKHDDHLTKFTRKTHSNLHQQTTEPLISNLKMPFMQLCLLSTLLLMCFLYSTVSGYSLTAELGEWRYESHWDQYRKWGDAEDYCRDHHAGGHLAWITSPEENDLVRSIAPEGGNTWIGLRVNMDPYFWSNGETLDDGEYSNFVPGEPNHSCTFFKCEECVQMRASGKWNDLLCNDEYLPATCKFPISCDGKAYYDDDVCGGVGECVDIDQCSCPTGYEASFGGDCRQCPEGSYCVNGTRTGCPTGLWSDGLNATSVDNCYPCPAYEACHNGVKTNCTDPEEAPFFPFDGQIGRNFCNICPAQYYVAYGDEPELAQCSICPVGHRCNGDGLATRCTGAQYASREGQPSCDTCPVGSHTTDDNILCLKCSTDEHCPDGDGRYTCSPGQYFDSGTLSCKPCPPGKFCSQGFANDCPSGYFVSVTDNRCLECPIGFYCPGDSEAHACADEYYANIGGLSSCKQCPVGHYTDNSGSLCSECIQGAYCPDGLRQIVCVEGEYLSHADEACFACPLGFYCQDFERQACSAGHFANETGLTNCLSCPKGTFHNMVAQTSANDCKPCEAGTYSSSEASTSCSKCPAGHWSNVTGSTREEDCIPCEPGTFSTTEGGSNVSTCLACPVGMFSTDFASTSCSLCPEGQFASTEGSINCTHCFAGSYSDTPGSTSCTLCPPGSYNEESGSSSENACVECVVGSSPYYGANSSDVCSTCTPGYRVFGSECLICEAGSYSTGFNVASCDVCDEGFYLAYEGATSADECRSCAPGSYSSERGSDRCTDCPAGTIGANVTGSTSSSGCTRCPSGFHSPKNGSVECLPCGVGTFSTEGAANCSHCPMGTYSDESKVDHCLSCPSGTFSDAEGSTECKLCASGTYNSHNGSISPLNCTKCPVGTFSTTEATVAKEHCFPCPVGSFCDSPGMSKGLPCPLGTFSTLEGSTSINNCVKCPAGTFSGMEGASSLDSCQSCPLGKYGPMMGAISEGECLSCPSGTFSIMPRATDSSACQSCPKGTYSPIPTNDCFECPIGTYNDQLGAPNSTLCLPCASHEITPFRRATSSSDCFSCPDGWYIDGFDLKCAPCPSGTYFDVNAEASNVRRSPASCIACGRGYFQPYQAQVGNETCLACGQGFYAPLEKNTECTACGKGYYSNVSAATSFSECSPCAPGTWSETVVANSSSTCLLCSPGTAQNVSGAPSAQYCRLCPIGSKSIDIGQAACTPCNAEEACIVVGSSFEVGLGTLEQESTSIYDPNSLRDLVLASYETLKYAIPFGLIGLILVCICCGCTCLLIVFRKKSARLFTMTDSFLDMKHFTPVGESNTREPSVLGGILSLFIVMAFMGLFGSILIDFIGNNKIVLESFVLENTSGTSGKFLFETVIVGRHKACSAEIKVEGFEISESESKCEAGVQYDNIATPIEGCRCSFNCINCRPLGNEHSIVFDFADEHMMSQSIAFLAEAPHYVPGQFYSVNGSMSSGNSIFSGNDLPHVFSFTMNNARYVATSSFGVFYELVGYSQTTVSTGYTIQISGKSPGSSQPNDENFVLSKGMQVIFDIDRAFGTVLSEEVLRQNLMTFLAQVLTLFSLLVTVGVLLLTTAEKLTVLLKRMPSKKVSRGEISVGHIDEKYNATSMQDVNSRAKDGEIQTKDNIESQMDELSSISESERTEVR
mmetsp:Transcript_2166/g.7909  ORF Transcript_2166/g.7909 Transcript_2166/m.7909 type:complete len:1841 (+) Transcript_2166:296-5818(+)